VCNFINPLAFLHVRLAPRKVFCVARIHRKHLQPVLFQNVINRRTGKHRWIASLPSRSRTIAAMPPFAPDPPSSFQTPVPAPHRARRHRDEMLHCRYRSRPHLACTTLNPGSSETTAAADPSVACGSHRQSLIDGHFLRHSRFSSVGVGPGRPLGWRSMLKLSNGVEPALVIQNNSPPNNGTLQPKSASIRAPVGARVGTTIACRARFPSSVSHRVTLPQFLAPWTRPPPGLGFYAVHHGQPGPQPGRRRAARRGSFRWSVIC